MDLGGSVLAAVVDEYVDPNLKLNEPRFQGMPRVSEYFNAGVLLINLDAWRRERISKKALEYLTHNPLSPLSDQDALNVACDGLWKKLDPRWNFQGHYEKRILDMNAEERPWIAHFVGRRKPWIASELSLNVTLYDELRSRTFFARKPTDRLFDIPRRNWALLKDILSRYVLFRTMWDLAKRELGKIKRDKLSKNTM